MRETSSAAFRSIRGQFHGRLDLSSPLDTAWELARACPDAELAVSDESGHSGADTMHARIRSALDRLTLAMIDRWAAWRRLPDCPAGYDRGDGFGVGGCRSRWQTTACTRTRTLSQATTRRMVPSSS